MPGQNMSCPVLVTITCWLLPVDGLKIAVYVLRGGFAPGVKSSALSADQTSTFPLGRLAACSGTSGSVMGAVHFEGNAVFCGGKPLTIHVCVAPPLHACCLNWAPWEVVLAALTHKPLCPATIA